MGAVSHSKNEGTSNADTNACTDVAAVSHSKNMKVHPTAVSAHSIADWLIEMKKKTQKNG